MNTKSLKLAMLTQDVTNCDLAAALNKKIVTMNRKIKGEIPFATKEILVMSEKLSLTVDDVNVIFFDGQLRNRNIEPVSTA